MSRIDSFYRRLEASEAEFRKLLIRELEGGYSQYLNRRTSNTFAGRSWRSMESRDLEKLEREISALRTKLGESPSDGPLRLVEEFAASYRDSGKEWWDGEGTAVT